MVLSTNQVGFVNKGDGQGKTLGGKGRQRCSKRAVKGHCTYQGGRTEPVTGREVAIE